MTLLAFVVFLPEFLSNTRELGSLPVIAGSEKMCYMPTVKLNAPLDVRESATDHRELNSCETFII